MRALTKFSRAWMSETNDSKRSAMNLTGRPSSMAAAVVRHLVAVGVDLEAERAADIRGDDLHVVVGDAQRVREHALDHVRALAAGVDGELARALVVGGEHGAGLEADGGVAAEVEGVLDDEIGLGEDGLDIAGVDRLAVGQVVAELGDGSPASWHRARSSSRRPPAAPAIRWRRARPRPRPGRAFGPRRSPPARRPSRHGRWPWDIAAPTSCRGSR